MHFRSIATGLLLGVAIAAGIWLSVSVFDDGNRVVHHATVLPEATPVPAFSLVDHEGNPIDEQVFTGRWDLVFFGFTHCPDVCPLTLGVLNQARAALAERGVEPLPRIVLVSVDPERDTPERIGKYLEYFGSDVLGITGDPEQIRALAEALYIYYEKRGDGDDYLVDHSSVVLLIGPDGRYRAVFSSPHRAEHFVQDLPVLMGA